MLSSAPLSLLHFYQLPNCELCKTKTFIMKETVIKIGMLFSSIFISNSGISQVYQGQFAHTFSIVARDVRTGEMAVGVQSHWFSVGTLVLLGKSGVGVVATQSFVNPAY